MSRQNIKNKRTPQKRPPEILSQNCHARNLVRNWAFDQYTFNNLRFKIPSKEIKYEVPPHSTHGSHSIEYNLSNRDKKTMLEKVEKKAMSSATGCFQQLFMMGFMLWMAGNSIQIFSIIVIGIAFVSPIKGLFNYRQTFAPYEESGASLFLPRLIYLVLQLCGIGLACYKLNSMGLLPRSWGYSDIAVEISRSVIQ